MKKRVVNQLEGSFHHYLLKNFKMIQLKQYLKVDRENKRRYKQDYIYLFQHHNILQISKIKCKR
jgi:hypothetical protein